MTGLLSYVEVSQAVLMHGSETCVMFPCIGRNLGGLLRFEKNLF